MDTDVQAGDHKEEVPKGNKEEAIETEKLTAGGETVLEKMKDDKKAGDEMVNGVGMKSDEAEEEDVKEVNAMKNVEAEKENVKEINGTKNDETEEGDVKETNGMKNDETKEGDLKDINEIKNDETEEGDVKDINGIKNDETEEGDVKDINGIKNDGAEKENVKKINGIKNEEAEKEDVKEIKEMDTDNAKKEDEERNEIGKSEAGKEADENGNNEAEKADKGVKDGEPKEKDGENEDTVAEEKNVSEGFKERVVKIDETPTFVEENERKNDAEGEDVSSCNVNVSSLSFKEESNLFSDLKDNEKKALVELRSRVEEAINGNQLFKGKEMEKPKENEAIEANSSIEEKEAIAEPEEKKVQEPIEAKTEYIDKDIKLWGVPLLASQGGKATDVVLLKFLRAREFKVIEAFEMLKNTLQWRKENNIDSISDEDLGNEFRSTAYINGSDRQGHPVCYNVFGVLDADEMFNKTLGTEENRNKFIRWRLQLMEEGIEKLDFNGVSSLLQIIDLKNTPGPSKKEVRLILKQVLSLLQDNYPEFVVKNIFINVPFWYYAFAALLSPFLTQRTKSKFVYARPAKVIETLLKYIDAEEIPVCYGGLKRDDDSDFSAEDHAEEVVVKGSSTETIEIPAPEAGSTVLIWDLVVLGWEVSYKEEFVPDDDKSYTIIVQKERKVGIQEGSIRNSFNNKEPGKIVLSIGNSPFKNKKRAFYRYKIKNIDGSSSS